jgi:hypothetical protein
MLIAYETDLICEFIKLLKLSKFLYLEEYDKEKITIGQRINYFDFLSIHKPNLITKLLSCPICLCFWLTSIFTLIKVFVFGQSLVFAIFLFPFFYFINLIIYLIIKKLL